MTEDMPKAVRVDIAIKTACEWIEAVEIIDPENVPTDAALALVMHLVSALREARKDIERLEWLGNRGVSLHSNTLCYVIHDAVSRDMLGEGDTFREAIDAARSADGGEDGK